MCLRAPSASNGFFRWRNGIAGSIVGTCNSRIASERSAYWTAALDSGYSDAGSLLRMRRSKTVACSCFFPSSSAPRIATAAITTFQAITRPIIQKEKAMYATTRKVNMTNQCMSLLPNANFRGRRSRTLQRLANAQVAPHLFPQRHGMRGPRRQPPLIALLKTKGHLQRYRARAIPHCLKSIERTEERHRPVQNSKESTDDLGWRVPAFLQSACSAWVLKDWRTAALNSPVQAADGCIASSESASRSRRWDCVRTRPQSNLETQQRRLLFELD